ncbi:uncharacterized protein LOC142331970 [Lycorma delicatula]|uniref:uncharacterized protein LOC142331970 n=1 Tax=Lycorma delicatula TaxID=130591 RepID=UPI003F50EFD1
MPVDLEILCRKSMKEQGVLTPAEKRRLASSIMEHLRREWQRQWDNSEESMDIPHDQGTGGIEEQKVTEEKKSNVKLNCDEIKHKVVTAYAKMNLKPEKGESTKDYLIMIRETNDLKAKPQWDTSKNTLTLSMIKARKNVITAQNLLEDKQKEFKKYCKERDEEIKEITEKENKLRESFEFFDGFVRENIEKRVRAEEKIKKEKEEREKINDEINKVKERLVHLNQLKNGMIKATEENKIFENYLIEVGKALPEVFSSDPEMIIERYELLKEVSDELSRLQWQHIESLQEISNKIDEETERRSEQLIDLNNLLTDLYSRRQVAGREVWRWKCVLKRVQIAAAESALETEQAQTACDDLYSQVCREMGGPADSPIQEDNSKKLHVILDRILELRSILKKANERASCNYSNRPNSNLSRPKTENPKPRTRP